MLMRPAKRSREGWAEDARRMVENGDDVDPFGGAADLNVWDNHPWPDESDHMTPISSPSIRSKNPK